MSKMVSLLQSNYIPWRGYFDIIRESDLLIIYDDVQYTKGDWRNRNRVKTEQGTIWMTVPVQYSFAQCAPIMETKISYESDWIAAHSKLLHRSLGAAPYFDEIFPRFCKILGEKHETISQLNVELLKWIMGLLEIKTPVRHSHEYDPQGRAGERVMDVLKKSGATSYLSGPNAKAYLTSEPFLREGIELYFKSYQYREYEQTHLPYDPAVTILDLLCNVGIQRARGLIVSEIPNVHVTARTVTL